MSDEFAGYYQKSSGSITGFDKVNTSDTNPNLAQVGWSVEQLRAYLQNQYGLNFLSTEWLQRNEAEINAHISNLDNPHETTLSQIVDDIIRSAVGAVVPGSIPKTSPIFSYDAGVGLPLGNIYPAEYEIRNIYRRTEGGWFSDVSQEEETTGIDSILGSNGLPMFNAFENITPVDWFSDVDTRLNIGLGASEVTQVNYPFPIYEVTETPVFGQFGLDIPMIQNLQVGYTTSFLVAPSEANGSIRIFRPELTTNYVSVDLENGQVQIFADDMLAKTTRYPDGFIRVAVSFISSSTSVTNKLRIVHINENASGDGSRQGSMGRLLCYIAIPQTTRSTINQPFLVDLETEGKCGPLICDLSNIGVPTALGSFIISMTLSMEEQLPLTDMLDSTILSIGDLTIQRGNSTIFVLLDGTQLMSIPIVSGVNRIALSYSPSLISFKGSNLPRIEQGGTFPAISSTELTVGNFGGYLRNATLYPQSDDETVLEFLTNG